MRQLRLARRNQANALVYGQDGTSCHSRCMLAGLASEVGIDLCVKSDDPDADAVIEVASFDGHTLLS